MLCMQSRSRNPKTVRQLDRQEMGHFLAFCFHLQTVDIFRRLSLPGTNGTAGREKHSMTWDLGSKDTGEQTSEGFSKGNT